MISPSELDTIRKRGYTDDEIWSKLSQSNPDYDVVKKRGYSLDDVASKYKGGEQTNENAESKSDQGPRSQGDAQRTLDGKVNATNAPGSEGGSELRPVDEGQSQRIYEARVSTDSVEGGEQSGKGKTTQTEAGYVPQVGQEDGQRIPSKGPTGNQEEVKDETSGVQAPAQGFFEEIKTPEGRKAAIASALETGIPMALGSVAAGIVAPAATAAAVPFTGPAAPLVGIGAGATTFLATQQLAEKILVKPVESLLGIKEDIEAAQAAAPKATKYGGYAGMAPFAIESAAGFLKTGAEAAAGAAEGEAIKEVAKAVGKKAASGLAGGVAFEPIRYGFEAAEKGVGLTDEAPKPITGESLLESGVMGMVLGGKVEKEVAKNEAGKNEIKSAGLPETAEVASQVKPDTTIEAEGKAEEATAKMEEEGKPQEVRIGAAAWKNDRTGAIYHGEDHESALEAARRDAQDPENKDKVAVGDLPKVDTSKPENRETPDFGFITNDGEFMSREEAQKFAEQSGQFKGKQTDRPVMHSNEVQMDFYEKKAPTTEVKARQLPGAASKAQFTEDRLSQSVRAIEDAEKAKGRALNVDNEGDKRAWFDEINKRFDRGTFSLDELNSLWNQSHEAYRIRNASGRTIPIEKAVQQIGGERIQSQRVLAAKNEEINKRREARGDAPLLPGREITQLGAWQEAAKRIAEDPQYLYNLTAELKQGKRTATAEESLALLQHRGEIENRIDDLSEQRNTETDPEKIKSIDTKLEKEYNDLRDAEQVYRNVGTEVSAALRVRRIQALADYSLGRSIARQEKAKGRKLTKEELVNVKSDVDKVKKLTEEVAGLNKESVEKRQDADIEAETKPTAKKGKLTADQQIEKHLGKLESNKDNPQKLSRTMKDLARAVAQKRLEEAQAKLGRPLSQEEQKQVTKPRDLSQATHDIASKALGDDWTLKDTRDAISGYGLYTNPDKSALSLAINRLTGENRNIGKIEDIVQGLAPKRTGKQRVKPDAGERALIKRVNALARKLGIKAKDPEAQLAGALESAKTRAKNLVEELEEIFLKGRPLNEETKAEIAKEDPELNNLKGEILGLRQLIEDTYGKREIPMERKVKTLEGIYDNLIKRYEKEIASGEVYKTTSKGEPITSEKLEQQRETLKNLRAERQHIRDADSLRRESLDQNKVNQQIKKVQEQLDKKMMPEKKGKPLGPKSAEVTALEKQLEDLRGQLMDEDWYKARKEAIALQAYKNRINTQIEDAKRRLAEGDYSKTERKEMKIDEEARLKRLELAELKDRIRQNQTLEEWKNRPPLQKALDSVIKFKRAAVLSYVSTLGKLTAASFEIPLLRIPTAAAGKVLERTPFFREIAQRARQEYGTPLEQDVKAYAEGLFDGVKEFKKIAFKLGRSELDLEYGDTSLIPLGALDVPGKLHEAIKNPTKRANYKMSYARYMQWAIREGLITDAESERIVREKAGIEAYKEANASIFLQDNGLVNKYNLLVNKMKESDSWRQRLAARFLEFNIPIVRIPANIVKEALEYQFGFFTGTSKAIRMKMSKEVGKRLEDISPEDADLIMRQIKKGSVGLMAMAIGYALPDYFGGFYRKGAEKDEEAPEYGGIGPIPKTLLHHPAFVPFQIGATLRKVWDESMFDRETFGDDAGSIMRGFAEGQMGLLEELPFVNLSRNVGKYIDPSRLPETGGEYAKSLIPGFIQETAKVLDVPEQDVGGALKTLFLDKKDVTKRKAETFLDHLKEGTPVLREQLEPK